MDTLAFFLPSADTVRQQELCYSVLSALKHCHDPDHMRWVLVAPTGITRPDLPLENVDFAPSDTPFHSAMQALCAVSKGKVCLIECGADFRADPAKLFDWISGDQILVHRRDTSGPPFVVGLAPDQFGPAQETDFSTAQLGQQAQLETCDDLIVRHDGHKKHIFHGRLRNLFPTGQVQDAHGMAPKLPRIIAPPQALPLRLRARLTGVLKGLDRDGRQAYLAYLCSQSAPTDQGRDVWANVTLDMILDHPEQANRIAALCTAFAADAVSQAKLTNHTHDRWARFWAGDYQGTS